MTDIYATIADAEAAIPPGGTTFFDVAGYYAAGDGGGGLYASAASGAAPGKIQTADGAWWLLTEDRPNPRMLGAKHDGVTDDTTAWQAWAQYIVNRGLAEADFSWGRAVLTAAINLPPVVYLGSATADFSGASSGPAFPDNWCLSINGGALTALPTLGTSIAAGDKTVTFSTSPSLASNDLFIAYDATTSSFSPYRTTYHAGEYFRVATLSGAAVTTSDTAYAAYSASNANLSFWKFPNASAQLRGALTVLGSPSVNIAMMIRRCRDVVIDGLQVRGGFLTALSVEECFNISGLGVTAEQITPSGLGDDYGIEVLSSQNVSIQGYFVGGRHGFATGASYGVSDDKQIPVRNVHMSGTFHGMTTDINAVGIHGNTDYWSVEGDDIMGVNLAGNHGRVRGTVRLPTGWMNWAYLSEANGTDFDLDANWVAAAANPVGSSQGMFNIGGTGNVTSDIQGGGTIRIAGTVEAPLASVLVRAINTSYAGAQPIEIAFACKLISAPTGCQSVVNSSAVGVTPFRLDLTGFDDLTGNHAWNLNTAKVRGWSATGQATVSSVVGQQQQTATLSGVYNAPLPPQVACNPASSSTLGGQFVWCCGTGATKTGFVIRATGPANFTSVSSLTIDWIAKLDQY